MFCRDLDTRIKIKTEESILARKQAKDSERKFRNTMMQAPVGITILRGRNMLVEMANQSYLEIFDRKEEDFVGKPLFDSLPDIREALSQFF